MKPNETGSNAYNAWLEQEYDPKILDDVEKAYLSAVIKPFRKDVKSITKQEKQKRKLLIFLTLLWSHSQMLIRLL